jgi:hypothetical protein
MSNLVILLASFAFLAGLFAALAGIADLLGRLWSEWDPARDGLVPWRRR